MKKRLIDRAKEFRNQWNEPIDIFESNQDISIIIPVYYPENLNDVLKHLECIGGFQEVILVDDSGDFEEQNYDYVKSYNNVKLYYHIENLGRSAARNTGAVHAIGAILIFLDQDMFLNPDFIVQVRRYYFVNRSLIFLGLRDTVHFKDIPLLANWKPPIIQKDWRVHTNISIEFIDLTVLNVGSAYNRCSPNDIICIANETDNLRTMGVSVENTIGFWDLPSMVVSHSMAIKKSDFIEIGGFPEWIVGWGGEDIVLGFMACSSQIPIYLSSCGSYQAFHQPHSENADAKKQELKRNIDFYRKWVQFIDELPCLKMEELRNRAKEFYGGFP